MSHFHEKGTRVNPTEHIAKTPTARSGFLVALASVFPARGTGAPSHRPRLRPLPFLLVLAFLAPLAASAVAPAPALATICNPTFAGSTGDPVVRTLTSAVLGGLVDRLEPSSCEATWRIEWSAASGGPWQLFPGGTGTVTGTQAAAEEEFAHFKTGELTGLEPETTYYFRGLLEPYSQHNPEMHGSFEAKPLHPFGAGVTVERSSITESSVHLHFGVSPSPFETQWRLEYSASKSALESGGGTVVAHGTISQAEAEALQNATLANSTHLEADLTDLSPNTAYYLRVVAEDEPEWPPASGVKHHKEYISSISESNGSQFETHGPPTAEASGTPALHGETIRVLGYVVPHGFDTHYRFQYGESAAYGSETAEEDAGSGGESGIEAAAAAADLPGLLPGRTYHYRIIATNHSGSVQGADHTVTVPFPGEGAEPGTPALHGEGPCPNQALRTGASARLPDCRAYEQVTPVEKGGAQQPFSYANQLTEVGALVGEDGNHLTFEADLVHWGSGQSPYFFSRFPSGWQMTPGAAQPEAGIDRYTPELFNPDLTSFAFSAGWGGRGIESPDLEFKAGLPGGPYPAIASIPRAQASLESARLGWVAASDDFSKLILATTDRGLVPGHPSTTASGADLYEYEPATGALRQANVTSAGAAIGSCGATIVHGSVEPQGSGSITAMPSSRHSLSVEGSRVFFEAVPGSGCSQPRHLFMRTGGAQTTDLGPYRFLAADPRGTELLLEAAGATTQQVVLYETATATAPATVKTLLTLHEHSGKRLELKISADFSTIYLETQAQLTPDAFPPTGGNHAVNSVDLYRYDVASESLRFITQWGGPPAGSEVSSDGRSAVFNVQSNVFYQSGGSPREAIRYDGVHNLLECASCSSFNPEPTLPIASASQAGSGVATTRNGAPYLSMFTADGSRIFFDTRSTLLPADVDGESPEEVNFGSTRFWSPASDVYEWRANGLEGCAHVQGCLALISSGRGGYLVQLLGASPSGRDVFFTTNEQLVPGDTDTSIDIYDARSGGGFPPPPPRPVECEGDACSTPFAAPNDLTPSSSTFQGAGNVLGAALPEVKPKPKPKPKKKRKAKPKKRKAGKKAKKSSSKRRARQ
jgi:hypothetical protein